MLLLCSQFLPGLFTVIIIVVLLDLRLKVDGEAADDADTAVASSAGITAEV